MDKKRIAQFRQFASENGATYVDAIFTSLGEIKNVSIKVPGINDPHLKKVSSHKIMVPMNRERKEAYIIQVGCKSQNGSMNLCFRRGDWVDKKMVTRQFFITPDSIGQHIIADIEVMKKEDLFRNESTYSLVIRQQLPNGSPLKAERVLKLGVEPKNEKNEFKIPGTQKVIRFEEK